MKIELRHYCRNSHCRSKLKEPVENYHKAFCARGCHSSFYLKRCLVCERPLAKKSSLREICNKPTCRSAFRVNRSYYRYPHSGAASNSSRNPIKMGIKSGGLYDRPWYIVAGPKITASVYHCATLPLDPETAKRR